MTRLTRVYRFVSSHRLHSPQLSEEENARVFGKCNNPYGHGHNYVLEVSVAGPVDGQTGHVVDRARLDEFVNRQIVSVYDHRDINQDVPGYGDVVPTTENVLADVERRLLQNWATAFPDGQPRLHTVRIRETKNNIFETTKHEHQQGSR